ANVTSELGMRTPGLHMQQAATQEDLYAQVNADQSTSALEHYGSTAAQAEGEANP
ncbi:hypothetical protein LTS02_004888, partial [Friedmanniomyces endolithicus]